jgi:hypothetical protein
MARVRFIVYEPPEKGLPFLAVTMIDSNFNAAVPAKTLKEAEAVFAKAEEAANHLRAAHNLHLERTGNSFGVLRNSWACERLRPGLRKNRSPSRKSKFSSPKCHGYSTNPFTTNRRGSDVRRSDSARKCRGRKAVAVLLVKRAASFPRGLP